MLCTGVSLQTVFLSPNLWREPFAHTRTLEVCLPDDKGKIDFFETVVDANLVRSPRLKAGSYSWGTLKTAVCPSCVSSALDVQAPAACSKQPSVDFGNT